VSIACVVSLEAKVTVLNRDLINTGLEAGDHGCTRSQAVSTASFLRLTQLMSANEFLKLLRERANPMVLFLTCDICGHLIDI
jgi:hypothetical protein